jgi:pimeloyl-ACP methyl ester carboxylesterase
MRVIAPDLLGSGDSASPPTADRSLAGHARTISEALEALGVEKFALAGHGHGGGVAQLLALGGGVEALILVDAIAFDAWPAPTIRQMQRDLELGVRVDPAERIRAMLDAGMSRPERLSGSELDGYLAPFTGPEARERFARAVTSFDGQGLASIEDELGTLEVPAIVLWGEDDAFVDVAIAERLGDALPRATIALLPGCGHFLLEDAAGTVVPLLSQWLRSQYLQQEHRHEAGRVVVQLGRPPAGEDG